AGGRWRPRASGGNPGGSTPTPPPPRRSLLLPLRVGALRRGVPARGGAVPLALERLAQPRVVDPDLLGGQDPPFVLGLDGNEPRERDRADEAHERRSEEHTSERQLRENIVCRLH